MRRTVLLCLLLTYIPNQVNAAPSDDALTVLNSLSVKGRAAKTGYTRAQFTHWSDLDRNGCDARNDTLKRDLTEVIYKAGTRDCKVISGLLLDPYSGKVITFSSAKSTIDIQTPYLITTELSRGLFKDAVSRGVKIRILTNSLSSTDNVEAFSSYQTDREKLLETGIRIFEFRPDAEEQSKMLTGELEDSLIHKPIFGLHAKSMVIDNEITVIGTFNLDPRSANLNTECIVIVRSDKISQGVSKGMEIEFKPENSWETTLYSNPDYKVDSFKRIKTWTRKIIPKEIL